VAGLFYPSDPRELSRAVDALLDRAGRRRAPGLRALIAPHAGHAYSGPIAASAFALAPASARVVLLGPSHFVPLDGMAVSGADAWATPLGEVPVAADLRAAAVAAGATVDDAPHGREHALEVELPFLQRSCSEGLEILPIAVGATSAASVATLVERLDAMVVVSTDLSHYLDHADAVVTDAATARAVLRREPAEIGDRAACGVHALRGLVEYARRAELDIELLDLRTSADTGWGQKRVVGYGAFALGVA
jgi:AmmeMemoRadiSam system protein B